MRFFVPGPPQGKGRALASTVRGQVSMRTPPKTVAYEAHIAQCAMAHYQRFKLGEALTMTIAALFPRAASWPKRRREQQNLPCVKVPDADNIAKAVCDGLQRAGVIPNDSAVSELLVTKRYVEPDEAPGLHITVVVRP